MVIKEFEKDFMMKKDLDSITKLNPEIRVQRIRELLNKITTQPEAKQDLENWKMEFSKDVVRAEARVLPKIEVKFRNVEEKFI